MASAGSKGSWNELTNAVTYGPGAYLRSFHLAVDAVGAKHGGGAVVLGDVLHAAIRCPAIGKVTVFCSPRRLRRFELPVSPKVAEIECAAAEATFLGRMHWLTRGLASETAALEPDLLLCMSGIGESRSSVPTVVFIQQSLPFCGEALRRCNLGSAIRMKAIGVLTKYSCREAALVVTQTPTMSEWIRKACGLTDKRIVVVKPWGDEVGMRSEQGGSVEAMLRVPAHLRILYVGNSSPYKNLGCLFAALPRIRRRAPGAILFLTCPADHSFSQSTGVVGLGYLGGSVLRSAYQLATVFVTPSLVESGNLTLVEAMTLGTPIAVADRPYARDLCGDAAVYFDPHRPAALATAVTDLIEDEAKRQRQRRRGLEVASMGRSERSYDSMMERFCALASRAAGSPFGISTPVASLVAQEPSGKSWNDHEDGGGEMSAPSSL
jgi:glycosyltransferase involved in cell wall biosynthesis